jgi:hypothetical protein
MKPKMCSVSKPSSAPAHAGRSAAVQAAMVQKLLALARIPDTTTASTAFAIEAAAGRQSYLREAQAYMLISMPTDTSTIFGAFQAIRVSQGIERDIARRKT